MAGNPSKLTSSELTRSCSIFRVLIRPYRWVEALHLQRLIPPITKGKNYEMRVSATPDPTH
jgi:hypothetical protein